MTFLHTLAPTWLLFFDVFYFATVTGEASEILSAKN
jgi:hypothetical protein